MCRLQSRVPAGLVFLKPMSVHPPLLGVATALWALWVSIPVCVANTGLEVMVDCPELDAEQRAAIQARQMSELRTRSIDEGILSLSCTADEVLGVWSQQGEIYSQRKMSRESGDDVNELLQWLGGMLIDTRGASPLSAVQGEGPPPEEESATVAAENVPTAPEQTRVALPTVLASAKPQSSGLSSTSVWRVGIGGVFHLWGTQVAGTLGPEVEVDALWRRKWGAALRWGALFSADSPSGFGVQDYQVGALAQWSPFEELRVGLGPLVSLLNVAAPQEAVGRASTLVTWGASVRGEYSHEVWKTILFAAVGMDWLATRREILLNDQVLIVAPAWQGAFNLGVKWRL